MIASHTKKIFALLFVVLLLFPMELTKTDAAMINLSKTVEFFIGQDATTRTSGEQFSFYFNNIFIPETPTVKSATIEISGISYSNTGIQTMNVDLQQGTALAGTGVDYNLGSTDKPRAFSLKYDAWQNGVGPMSDINLPETYDYTLYLKGTSVDSTGSFSISSAKLILTYEYSSSETDLIKTTKFFAEQKSNNIPSGTENAKDFSISISEKQLEIKNVFVEISGNAKGGGAGTIEISVVDQGLGANYTVYNLDLSPLSSKSKFTIIHDASTNIVSSDFPGEKYYTLYFKGTGFDTDLLKAKIIVTYKYSEASAGLPISGYIISSTIDTQIVKGAAFNALMWQGSLNGGKVRLQIATSNCSGGQSDYPLCSVGNWGDINTPYAGIDCSSATYYEPLPNEPAIITCLNTHNNKQYFRYKVTLCSSADCAASGLNTPEITDIIINWSR